MLDKSFGLFFYLKKPKNYRIGLIPIHLRITVDALFTEDSTKFKCDPAKWNGKVIGTKENARLINHNLDILQNKIYEARRQLIEQNNSVTAESLKDVLIGKPKKARMLIEFFQQHSAQRRNWLEGNLPKLHSFDIKLPWAILHLF
jgi:Arm DNA-binding domain